MRSRAYGVVLLGMVMWLLAACPAPTPVPSSVEMPTTFTVQDLCRNTVGRSSLDEVRDELFQEAQRRALQALYGEYIRAITEVENFQVLRDRLERVAAGRIYLRGNPVYEQGANLGDVCITATFYTTEEDLGQFRPRAVRGEACLDTDQVPRERIQAETRRAAELDALYRYDAGLRTAAQEQALSLLREIQYLRDGFVGNTSAYCVEVQAQVIPVMVEEILRDGPTLTSTFTPTWTSTPTPTPSPTATHAATATPAPTFTPRPPTPRPTNTPTSRAGGYEYDAPQLLSPANGERFGVNDRPVLSWQGEPLKPGDYFLVLIRHALGSDYQVRADASLIPPDFLHKSSAWQDGFPWQVAVCRGATPGGYASLPCTLVSPWSEQRTFRWDRLSGGGGGNGSSPLPTPGGSSPLPTPGKE